MTTPPTDPTPEEIALLSRMETAMRKTHDEAFAWNRWTETAKAALAVVADWQQEERQEGRETA